MHANIAIQNDIYYSMLSRHALNVSWVILLSTQCNGVVFTFFYYDYFQKKNSAH